MARFLGCVSLLLRKRTAWRWHLPYGLEVFALRPLRFVMPFLKVVSVTEDGGANSDDEF